MCGDGKMPGPVEKEELRGRRRGVSLPWKFPRLFRVRVCSGKGRARRSPVRMDGHLAAALGFKFVCFLCGCGDTAMIADHITPAA